MRLDKASLDEKLQTFYMWLYKKIRGWLILNKLNTQLGLTITNPKIEGWKKEWQVLKRWKVTLLYRVSIKPNTGFLKGLIKLTNFRQDLWWIKAGKEPIKRKDKRRKKPSGKESWTLWHLINFKEEIEHTKDGKQTGIIYLFLDTQNTFLNVSTVS